ncbi:hypothetical protein LTS18_011166, partial [Coniosporium uncinatum]
MSLKSDITLNAAAFDPANTSPATHKLNESLIAQGKAGPKWWEVGAAKYREMRWNNETPLPRPPVIESGKNGTLPSREKGRDIPYRMFLPEAQEGKTEGDGQPGGVFMHIHGGGWTLMTEHFQDSYLKFLADNSGLAVVSVGYRLAPEDPFPKGPEDCYDAAEFLVEQGKEKFGGELVMMGGESAGGHLSLLTALHLLHHRPSHHLKGLVLNFGAFDLSFLPSTHHFQKPLIIDWEIMNRYIDAFLPGMPVEAPHTQDTAEKQVTRRSPEVSPFYADLSQFRGKLPLALFTCGTEDPLLDDSVMMG